MAAARRRNSIVDGPARNRARAAASACSADSSLLEARPPRSNSGELNPAYSQSTSQSRLPSSMKLAASRSLWPKTTSIGPTAASSRAARARRSVEHGKVAAAAFAQRMRVVAHDVEHPEHRRQARARYCGMSRWHRRTMSTSRSRLAGLRTSSGVKVRPSTKSRTSDARLGVHHARGRARQMRRAARGKLVRAHHAMHRDVAADAHDVAAAAILDPEVLVGDAAGERQRLDPPEPDRQLGDARRRLLLRGIRAHLRLPACRQACVPRSGSAGRR